MLVMIVLVLTESQSVQKALYYLEIYKGHYIHTTSIPHSQFLLYYIKHLTTFDFPLKLWELHRILTVMSVGILRMNLPMSRDCSLNKLNMSGKVRCNLTEKLSCIQNEENLKSYRTVEKSTGN